MNTVQWVIFDLGGIVIPETLGSIIAQVAADAGLSPQRLAEAIMLYHDEAIKGKRTLLQVYRSVASNLAMNYPAASYGVSKTQNNSSCNSCL